MPVQCAELDGEVQAETTENHPWQALNPGYNVQATTHLWLV